MAKPANHSLAVGTKVWADRINAALQASLNSAIDAGDLLIQAKEQLAHGAYEKMVLTEIRCDPRTAQRLVAVAKDDRIRRNASLLPLAWTTLYELTKLKDDAFQQSLDSGALSRETKRKDVPALADQRPTVTDADYEDITDDLGSADVTESPRDDNIVAGDAVPQPGDNLPPAAHAADDASVPEAVVTDPPEGGITEDQPSSKIIAGLEDALAGRFKIHNPGAGAEPEAANAVRQPLADEASVAAASGRTVGSIPATGANLLTITQAEYDALVKRATAAPFLVAGRPIAALEYCLSLLRSATKAIEPADAAAGYAAAMYSDDIDFIANWLLQFGSEFRDRFDIGTAAALELDAAQ